MDDDPCAVCSGVIPHHPRVVARWIAADRASRSTASCDGAWLAVLGAAAVLVTLICWCAG